MSRVALGVLCAAVLRAAITPESILQLRDPTEIALSPDGREMLFTLKTGTRTELLRWRDGREPEAVAGAPQGAASLVWSPRGAQAAFLGGGAIWIWERESGAIRKLCRYERPNAYLAHAGPWLAWSPDGQRLAFAGTAEPKPAAAEPLVISRALYKTRTGFSDNRRTHVFTVALADGIPRQITSGDRDAHSVQWLGGEVLYLANPEPEPDVRHNYDLYAVDPASGRVRRLTETPGVEMEPRVSPDGGAVAFTATTRAITTIDSVAEDAHVWTLAAGGGPAREVNRAQDRRSASPQWLTARDLVWSAQDRGRVLLYRESQPLFERDAQVHGFSAAGGAAALVMSAPDSPREVWLWREGRLRQVTSFNAALARDWNPVKPEPVRFASFDGRTIEGWLYPARGRKPAPLLLWIHGGPHGQHGYGFNATLQYASARGYTALAINPRGSSGYGQEFSDGTLNDWGGGDYRDLMAGVDHVLAGHAGEIDRERLGVAGPSYGGYMTNWIVTQTPRFKAAVAIAGLSNLISFYATSLYQDLIHAEFGGAPWEGRYELLWDRSPLKHVARVRTPVLLLHGEADNDVHITQAEEMFTALRHRGVPAELVRYPRAGHSFSEPRQQADLLRRQIDWMDRYLK